MVANISIQQDEKECQPLSVVMVTQPEPPAPRVAPDPDEKPAHISVDDDDNASTSESMYVQVTIYSLHGIMFHVEEKKSTAMKLKKRTNIRCNGKSPAAVFGGSSNCGSSHPPTTAIVAVQREKIKTFLPSMPLKVQASTKPGDDVRCSAYWRDDGCTALRGYGDSDDPLRSTFELTRCMKRETFQPGTKIGQVSHFVHERIDLDVGVGKGKELIHLGIASVVISGDEDGEVVTNVPVRALLSAGDRQGKRSYKMSIKKKSKQCFQSDSNMYCLDENATLRVGTRILSQHMKDAMGKPGHFYLECDTDETSSQNMIIELNDEKSLIARWRLADNDGAFFTGNSQDETPKTNHKSGFATFFCGTLQCCTPMESTTPPVTSMLEVMTTETQELPFRLMSDVSGKISC